MRFILLVLVYMVIVDCVERCSHPQAEDGHQISEGCLLRTCKAGVWRTSLVGNLCCYERKAFTINTTISSTMSRNGCVKANIDCVEEIPGQAKIILSMKNYCEEYATEEQMEEIKELLIRQKEVGAGCQGGDEEGDEKGAMPHVRLDPQQQVVRPRSSPQIECQIVDGDPPFRIDWFRETESGQGPLPTSAIQRGPILQFQQIDMSDEGKYICVAQDNIGISKAVAEVLVNEKFPGGLSGSSSSSSSWSGESKSGDFELSAFFDGIVNAGDDGDIIEIETIQGATVDLPCRLAPSDDMTWQKERGSLPDRATQVRTALRIERVKIEDFGMYICNSQGRMHYVNLMVKRLSLSETITPSQITIKQSSEATTIGNSLWVICEVSGVTSRGYTIKWSKAGHTDLDDNIKSIGGTLRFDGLTKENEGLYRCMITTSTGPSPYKDFFLSVQGSE